MENNPCEGERNMNRTRRSRKRTRKRTRVNIYGGKSEKRKVYKNKRKIQRESPIEVLK